MKGIVRALKRMAPIKEAGFKSASRQYAEMLWLGAFYKLSPLEYQAFEFGKKNVTRKHIRTYLRVHDAEKKLRPTLNSRAWAPMLTNKLLFNSYFSQRQMPVARLYGMFHPQFGGDLQGNPLHNRDDLRALINKQGISEFVLKPLAGKTGAAVLVLEKIRGDSSDLVFADRSGKEYDLDSLVAHMSQPQPFTQQGFILEARLENHPVIAEINPSSVNTCRLVTFIDKKGKLSLLFTVLRIGVAGKNTDNWHTGGLAAGIDPATGTIGPGLIRRDFLRGGWHSRHPDTGIVFAGKQIPDWDKIIALVAKAAPMAPFVRTIGWDVAATPEGPVIIEANFSWGPLMCQACTQGLLTPELRREFAEFGLSFPS